MRPILLATTALCIFLSACGSSEETPKNGTAASDAAVVEGTIDDRMTDLDAAQVDFAPILVNNASAGPDVQPARRANRDTPVKEEQDAEAVAAE